MRDNSLKSTRDKKMIEMFHQLHNVKRIRIDDVLEELSKKHFFLKTDYIYAVIFYNKENFNYYNSLSANND